MGCTSLPHSANSLTEGQILFLKKCHNHPKSQPIGGYISKVASNNETSLIERFVDLGLLSGATLAEKLEDMPVAELKALFHKLGLVPKKNARKQLLIDSLLTSCDNATLSDQVQHLGALSLNQSRTQSCPTIQRLQRSGKDKNRRDVHRSNLLRENRRSVSLYLQAKFEFALSCRPRRKLGIRTITRLSSSQSTLFV